MNRLDFPDALPPCRGLAPVFLDRFSGWCLGMGQPGDLATFLRGLAQLAEEQPACRAVLPGMALWGFQAHPLGPDMAAWCARLSGNPASVRATGLAARLLRATPLADADGEAMDAWYALARQDDRGLILRFLTLVLRDPDKGLSWLGHCWNDLLFLDRPEVGRAALDMVAWDAASLPLKDRLAAEWAFHRLPPEEALDAVLALDPTAWGLWRTYAGAELLLRMGKKGEAKGALAQLWKGLPWHVNLTLKLHDLFAPVVLAGPDAASDAAVLVYSWNKADLLADTLESLAQCELGGARIFALDNGSTDRTPEVLAAARDRFGRDRLHVETLPVNVGAPAARNWLLSLEGVRSRKWAAFLDDDVVLPENWLLHLLGAADGRDDLGAVGCRITAAVPPFGLQSADYNLIPKPPRPTEPGGLPNRVLVFDNCAGSPDTGMFAYTRPCLSVSGCCHMVALSAVDKAGGFDLRYTPSQFDDLDRDLRSALGGMPALYAGTLAVRHVQHSSLAKAQTARQIGHVMGNKYKLDTKYSDEQLATLVAANRELLRRDYEARHGFLVDRLGTRG
ncbi:glycosyltransferase [Pseudodesulfovibrio sp.]|uniref:glycosyltransferase n=1 Tax=Pseudodesulfovibrio sp. TaxID=2035812 RepID=UPI00260C8077|nr:glycosyltransferase [Pseudodesulfovibrio sp.]MDD3311990.1 glycosyltransferase [Pseudodesulfovibrio sp.]